MSSPIPRLIRRHWQRRREINDEDQEEGEVVADNPRPEDWVPQVMVEVCQDILQGLASPGGCPYLAAP